MYRQILIFLSCLSVGMLYIKKQYVSIHYGKLSIDLSLFKNTVYQYVNNIYCNRIIDFNFFMLININVLGQGYYQKCMVKISIFFFHERLYCRFLHNTMCKIFFSFELITFFVFCIKSINSKVNLHKCKVKLGESQRQINLKELTNA